MTKPSDAADSIAHTTQGLRIRRPRTAFEEETAMYPPGDGVALTTIAHPEGLIDAIADAIRSGKLKL